MDSTGKEQTMKRELLSYIQHYSGDIETLRMNAKNQATREEYATKGKNMGERGRYDPSLYTKYLVHNCMYGDILDKKPQDVRGKYFYLFDDRNRLIYAKQYPSRSNHQTEEFLFYEGSTQISLIYDQYKKASHVGLHAVTRCEYNIDVPMQYCQLYLISSDAQAYSLTIEQYDYVNNRIDHLWMSKYIRVYGSNQVNKYGEYYSFKYDTVGNLIDIQQFLSNPFYL